MCILIPDTRNLLAFSSEPINSSQIWLIRLKNITDQPDVRQIKNITQNIRSRLSLPFHPTMDVFRWVFMHMRCSNAHKTVVKEFVCLMT